MHSKEKERMPVSCMENIAKSPAWAKLECFADFGGSEGAKESPQMSRIGK